MRQATVFVRVAAVGLLSAALVAQAKPNFAGKWVLIPDAAATAGAVGGRGGGFFGGGAEFTATQDEKTLTITRSVQGNDVKSVYNLDGSDSKNTLSFGGNSMDQISKAKWDGAKLAITTTLDFGGNSAELKSVYSLDASGNLVVETTRPDFQGGGSPVTTTAKYKKG